MVIEIPQNSFIRPDGSWPGCRERKNICLPLHEFTDLAWMLNVVDNNTTGDIKATALKINCEDWTNEEIHTSAYLGGITSVDASGYEAVIQFAGVSDLTWEDYNSAIEANGFDPIEPGDCFRIFMYQNADDGDTLLSCSQCFQRVSEKGCYLSLIEYTNNENAFGFLYENNGVNRLLLPVYLHSPELVSDSDIFVKSNQSQIKLREVIDRSFVLETMPFYFDWHQYLKVALSHDSLKITNQNQQEYIPLVDQYFVAENEYKFQHQKFPSLLIKGTVNVKPASAVSLRNLNCE